MPTCSICALTKEPDAFYSDKRNNSGYRPECKDCAEIIKERRKPPSTLEALVAVPDMPRPTNVPEADLADAIKLRMTYYRCSALDALFDLANMPVDKNSALMQVKFMAASRLAGPQAADGSASGQGAASFDNLLSDLNTKFHKAAPKLRMIRERVATFDDGSEQKVIEG